MKKLFALMLSAILLCVFFTGCGGKSSDQTSESTTTADNASSGRILYKSGLDKYVKLGDYKGITVDKASDEFKKVYDSFILSDVTDHNFYSDKKITEGTVQNGDIANIDYEGKKNGVAFEGGTDTGHELTIGSGSFIPGFEEGLIGKKIGSTVDLDLKFPDGYHAAELAGQAVVFTVKINYIKQPMKPEEFFDDLGFKSVEEYKKDVEDRAVDQYLTDKVENSSDIQSYPEDTLNYLYQEQKKEIENSLKQQGADFSAYLQYLGMTEEEYKKELSEQYLKPIMKSQMIAYAIFDQEKLSTGTDRQKDWEEESEAVSKVVSAFLLDNAIIK